jgi:bloom syndrome protein
MALTASANDSITNDIIGTLQISNCVFLKQSFNRPNLHYEVREKKKKADLFKEIAEFIGTQHASQTGIIYCFERKECEEVAQALKNGFGLKTQPYHAGMSSSEKKVAQDKWQRGQAEIIVSTVSVNISAHFLNLHHDSR